MPPHRQRTGQTLRTTQSLPAPLPQRLGSAGAAIHGKTAIHSRSRVILKPDHESQFP
jgi:hypothetical protein